MTATRDPHRPGYHFLPPRYWMNDPNGLIHFRGRYHIFFQHNPHSIAWGNMHWGHAVSDDMVRWRHLPPAIAPTPNGYDKDGVWSGCCVDDNGTPKALYTGVQPEVQCLAIADNPDDPDLRTWTKHPGNPVITARPPIGELAGFRDPCVWREGDDWIMAIGSGLKATAKEAVPRGCILLYQSRDLVAWKYLHTLCVGDEGEGEMWECPSFFPLGGSQVLIRARYPLGSVMYSVGDYSDRRFLPRIKGEMDNGGSFYAPQVFRDGKGRQIMFGWLWERRSKEAYTAADWASVQTLPRVLTLGEDGTLRYAPAEEVSSLRMSGAKDHQTWPGLSWSGERVVLAQASDTIEIELEMPPAQGEAGIAVRCTPDGSEQTRILWNAAAGRLVLDTTRASLDETTTRDRREAILPLSLGEPLRLRVFVDRSVIEVFANNKACLTGRVYPTRGDALGVNLVCESEAKLSRLSVWNLDPVMDRAPVA